MNETTRRAILERLRNANPHPTTELIWSTPFELLVAVMLSARTTDVSVNKATQRLFITANTPAAFSRLSETELKNYIAHIGLYNNKARNLLKMCKILQEQHNGAVPNNFNDLTALPGVGRKTANVVLNVAFNSPTVAVDTHVFRISNRTGLATGKNPQAVEKNLLNLIPPEFFNHLHHWLILQGRHVCIARKPRCQQCLIVDLCEYRDKNL